MLNKEQIMEILPHRPPMLLVDEILEMDENHVVGALHLTGDEFFFQGHFPGNPIMPAVFRLEALAQAGGVALLSLPEFKGKTAVYTGIDKAKFRAMAKPGDTLCIIEAMKIMNEIKAPCDGKVIRIMAQPGDMVEYNQVLCVIE